MIVSKKEPSLFEIGNEACVDASVASFNPSCCSLRSHSCPIKSSSSYLCVTRPLFHSPASSVCLKLVKIYSYQMLSALLTSAHLSHCGSACLIRSAWPIVKSTIREAIRSYSTFTSPVHRRVFTQAGVCHEKDFTACWH